jgi:hypothetical protein
MNITAPNGPYKINNYFSCGIVRNAISLKKNRQSIGGFFWEM